MTDVVIANLQPAVDSINRLLDEVGSGAVVHVHSRDGYGVRVAAEVDDKVVWVLGTTDLAGVTRDLSVIHSTLELLQR